MVVYISGTTPSPGSIVSMLRKGGVIPVLGSIIDWSLRQCDSPKTMNNIGTYNIETIAPGVIVPVSDVPNSDITLF
ncbi:hypothetical protein J6590_060343 [Homalodisca vitripennis]|nr:hypothetical protein J6590_060343 [Homalodisca vitripennis]